MTTRIISPFPLLTKKGFIYIFLFPIRKFSKMLPGVGEGVRVGTELAIVFYSMLATF